MNRNYNKKLLNALRGNLNHADGDPVAVPVLPTVTGEKLMTISPGKYNPPFRAQVQIQFLKNYYTVLAGVFTQIAPAGLGAGLNVDLPAFLFLNTDFESGYAKLKSEFPVSGGWAYNPVFVYGKQPNPGVLVNGVYTALDATASGFLRDGDLVLPFSARIAGTDYVALTVVRSSDVPFASMLGSTNSNTFDINMLRYTVNNGQDAQFSNGILVYEETMFGKLSSDPINPEAFKNPEQQQQYILDIDVNTRINKQKGLATTIDYDVLNVRWNLFIQDAKKLL